MEIIELKKIISEDNEFKIIGSDNNPYVIRDNFKHVPGTNNNLEIFYSELFGHLLSQEIGALVKPFKLVKIKKKDDISLKKGIYFANAEDKDIIPFDYFNTDLLASVTKNKGKEIFEIGCLFSFLGFDNSRHSSFFLNKKDLNIYISDFSHSFVTDSSLLNSKINVSHLNSQFFHKFKDLKLQVTDIWISDAIKKFDYITLSKIKDIVRLINSYYEYSETDKLIDVMKTKLSHKEDHIKKIALELNTK